VMSHAKRVTGNLVRRLQRLGFDVTIAHRLAPGLAPFATWTWEDKSTASGGICAGRRDAVGTFFSATMSRLLHVPLGLLLLATGCRHEAVYDTAFAPDFSPPHHVVSVLGVYKDGRMSSEAWDAIAARVSRSLGAAMCEAAYAQSATSPNHALWSAVDEYTLANGPTDDLLAKIAPAAGGDLVLVVIVAGRLPTPEKINVQDENQNRRATGSLGPQGGMGAGAGAGLSRNSGPTFRGPAGPAAVDRLDLSASLFSVPKAASVARVALEYSGESVDEAIAGFTAKLASALPGATCTGWNWEAKIDPEAIR
jgi:hypothetical protein